MEETKRFYKGLDIAFLLVMLALALLARYFLYDFASGDYTAFLQGWMDECAAAGGWAYVAIDPLRSTASSFNYSCMYQYVICFLNLFRGVWHPLYLIKTFSVVFDVLCAFAAMGIVRKVSNGSRLKTMLAFGLTLALPTVVMNSAAWAQADSIYTFFLLVSFLALLKEKEVLTWVFFGIALAFKLQAVFFLPFLILAWIMKKTSLGYIFVSALVYILSMVPAYLLGRPIYSLIETYTSQVGLYTQLSMNYPNIYTVIPDNIDVTLQRLLIPAGVVVTLMLLALLAYAHAVKRFEVSDFYLLSLAAFTMQLVVFTLPVMHERYAYPAGIFLLLYGLFGAKRMSCAIGVEALTIATYARFLYSSTVIKLYPLAAVQLLILLVIAADLWHLTKIPCREKEDAGAGDGMAEEYISEAAAAGVPRVSDIRASLERGEDLKLQPQAGDVEEDVISFAEEEAVPTLASVEEELTEEKAGTDRDRTQPEQETKAYHAPTLAELFGQEYATETSGEN